MKKIIALFVVITMISASIAVLIPDSEARSVDGKFNQSIMSMKYVYCEEHTMEEKFTIKDNTYADSLYLFEKKGHSCDEIVNAVKNGNLENIQGRIPSVGNHHKGDYIFLVNTSEDNQCHIIYYKDGEEFHLCINNKIDGLRMCAFMELSCGKGDSVTVDVGCKANEKLSAYIVSNALMNLILNKGEIHEYFHNDAYSRYIMDSKEKITDNFTLNFRSEGVANYYLVIVVNDTDGADQHGTILDFSGSANASGLSDTANPLPFAILLFVISLAVVGGIIYFGRMKVI